MYQSQTISTDTNNIYTQNFNFNMNVDYFNTSLSPDDKDELFRKQMLTFFKLEEYNETTIDIKLDILKPLIQDNEQLKELTVKFSNLMLQDKFDIGIVMFFSFDYFYSTFLLLKEYVLENTINETIYNNLIKKL